jgi:hypothetical protein
VNWALLGLNELPQLAMLQKTSSVPVSIQISTNFARPIRFGRGAILLSLRCRLKSHFLPNTPRLAPGTHGWARVAAFGRLAERQKILTTAIASRLYRFIVRETPQVTNQRSHASVSVEPVAV